MARQNLESQFGAFALGIVVGLVFKEVVKELYAYVRVGMSRAEQEGVVRYPQNLPDSLERREPAPHPGQIRFGGTGALGVSPEAIRQGR